MDWRLLQFGVDAHRAGRQSADSMSQNCCHRCRCRRCRCRCLLLQSGWCCRRLLLLRRLLLRPCGKSPRCGGGRRASPAAPLRRAAGVERSSSPRPPVGVLDTTRDGESKPFPPSLLSVCCRIRLLDSRPRGQTAGTQKCLDCGLFRGPVEFRGSDSKIASPAGMPGPSSPPSPSDSAVSRRAARQSRQSPLRTCSLG